MNPQSQESQIPSLGVRTEDPQSGGLHAPWARKTWPRGPRDFCHGLLAALGYPARCGMAEQAGARSLSRDSEVPEYRTGSMYGM